MQTETIGRAKLVIKNSNNACIFIKDRMCDSFDAIPRPVKHVGTEKYIRRKWNYIKEHRDQYLQDPKTLKDYFK